MTRQAPPPSDEPRDSRLRAALRHAPDAEVRPPQSLSDAILQQARASAAAAPVPGKAATSRLSAWALLAGAWVALSRPSLASGLASVMLASLVGVMWWNRLPDDTGELPRLEKGTPPTTAAAPAADPTTAPAPVQALPQATGQARRDEASGAVHDERAPRVTRESAETRIRQIEETAERKPKAAAQAVAESEPGPARAEAPPAAEPLQAPLPAPVPAMAPAAPPVAAAAPDTARLQERASAPPLKPSGPLADDERRRGGGGVATTRTSAPAAEIEASTKLGKAASADMANHLNRPTRPLLSTLPPAPPLSTLRQSLSQEAGPWSWRRDGGPAQPVTPALLRWLAALDAHAAGPRWTAAPAGEAAAGDVARLEFQRDGRTQHELALQADGLHWHQAEPAAAWKLPLDAPAHRELRSALPPAAP